MLILINRNNGVESVRR